MNPAHFDLMHTSTSDTGAQLDIHGLEAACGLLGGTHAWVTRNTGDSCQLVNLSGSALEIDSSLNSLLVHSAQNSHGRPVLLLRWRDKTIMCASLSTQQEADGCTYTLSMLFDGPFELTASFGGLRGRPSVQHAGTDQLAAFEAKGGIGSGIGKTNHFLQLLPPLSFL